MSEVRSIYPTFVSDLHKATSKDKLRAALNCVFFKDGYAYASDGHVAIEQSLPSMNFNEEDIELMNGKGLLASSYALARKAEKLIVHEDCIACHMPDGSIIDVYWSTEKAFPDVRRTIEQARKKPKEQNNSSYFYFNAKLMNTLLS